MNFCEWVLHPLAMTAVLCPMKLSSANQSSNLPPRFRPSGSWINTATVWSPFFSLFLLCVVCKVTAKLGCAFISVFEKLYFSVGVCDLGWALMSKWLFTTAGHLRLSPVTRGNHILLLCLYHTLIWRMRKQWRNPCLLPPLLNICFWI